MQRDRKLPLGDKRNKSHPYPIPISLLTFLLGCIISTSIVLNVAVHSTPRSLGTGKETNQQNNNIDSNGALIPIGGSASGSSSSSRNPLDGIRILIAIAAYGESNRVRFFIPLSNSLFDFKTDLIV